MCSRIITYVNKVTLPVIILAHGPCGPVEDSVYCAYDAVTGVVLLDTAKLAEIAAELLGSINDGL